MRILFFGGTGFVGRHTVERAIARGHDAVLVCRGRSDPHVFPGVPRIQGDRLDESVVAAIASIARADPFDAVVDTSAYLPREARASLRAIASMKSVHYVFVSTVSVYADHTRPPNEDTKVAEPIDADDADDAVLTVAAYGRLKVACERAIEGALGDRSCIVRPGRILGPHDSDPRAPWFLRRIAEGGEVLAAGDPDAPVQCIDARDFANFVVECAERRIAGTYNTVSPPFSARDLHEAARTATSSDAGFTWVPDDVLAAHEVKPYTDAPFWLPRAYHEAMRIDAARAIAKGLAFRPVVETLRDEWSWMGTGWDAASSVRAQKRLEIPAGIAREKERAILEAMRPAR